MIQLLIGGIGLLKEVREKVIMCLARIETMIIDARMPGVATKRENVAIELFGEKRPFLIVSNLRYKEFKMYINARDLARI